MTAPTGRRRLRRLAVVWVPLLAVAAAGGWMLTPSRGMALASTSAGPPPAPVPAGGLIGAGGVPASTLFQQDCAACHGDTGRGTRRGPSLAGVGEAAVDFELSTGRMPKKDVSAKLEPYRATLPAADIKALDRYVTALVAHGGPGVPSVVPAAGDESKGEGLFMENCAACHGFGGAGGVLFDRPVPKITEATPTQIGEALRVGPAEMPVFGPHQITPAEVNDIAAYIDSLKHPYDKGGDPISHLGPVAEGAVIWLVAIVGLIFVTRWIGKRG
ncbi:MAG TPA: c-type cytochrome [Acidimicrobiales bacterium]|nr:c-type cytochrome [Acidimicrobiales bacterium]